MTGHSDVIHVACQTNHRFVADCAVMLTSLLTANAEDTFDIHVLHQTDLPTDDIEGLNEIVTGHGSMFTPLLVDDRSVQGFPDADRYGGVTAWLRVLLPRLLPDVDKVLYLDADLLVLDRVRALWTTALEGKAVAAVTQPTLRDDRTRVTRDLQLPDPSRYFNSGVMLLDLAVLRATGLMTEVEAYAVERRSPMPWADQDPLNAILWSHRAELHPRWNVMNPLFHLPDHLLPWPAEQIRQAVDDPAIVHFIGPYKPWHHRLRHPYSAKYFEHLRSTPWHDRPLEGRSLRHVLLRPLPPYLGMRIEELEQKARRRVSDVAHRGRDRMVRRTSVAPQQALHDLLEAFASAVPSAHFVQIGSNDGTHGDPLAPYIDSHAWHGILVEPVPHVFERLVRRHGGNPRLRLENVAVGETDGPRPFYFVPDSDDPGLPDWYDQLGSFDRDTLLHAYHVEHIPDLEHRLVAIDVPCVTFSALWTKHQLPRLDLLHTDAEGSDDEILLGVDLGELRPLLVLWESKHLTAARQEACVRRLERAGYHTADVGPDSVALRDDAPPSLRRTWRRSRLSS